MSILSKLFLVLLLSFFPVVTQAQSLVLIVDSSDSMDVLEKRYQAESYVTALSDLTTLDNHRVDVILFANEYRHVVENGTRQDAIQFFSNWVGPAGTTCIHAAIGRVLEIYDDLPPPVIIDITGDGKQSCSGKDPKSELQLGYMLDELRDRGAKINTLFLGDDMYEYQFFSAMQRNGFSLLARDYIEFELALYEKLILELMMLERPLTDNNG